MPAVTKATPRQPVFRYIWPLALSLLILASTPINTSLSYGHMLGMGVALLASLAIPYLVTRYVYQDQVITFPFRLGRHWYRREITYIFVTAILAYLIIPFYLLNSGAYHNWTVEPGANNLIRLFIGTNALGIWDELFFIATALTILRRLMPFWLANLIQAVLFTTFLYELGFRGWGPLIIYPFALLQGYIFSRTKSLLYVITIHLTLDFILYLALIYTHHPTWLPIFIFH